MVQVHDIVPAVTSGYEENIKVTNDFDRWGSIHKELEARMLMTIDDVVAYLKVSKETIYKMAQRQKIPAVKVGNQWRFKKEIIDQWIDESSFKAISHQRLEEKSRRI